MSDIWKSSLPPRPTNFNRYLPEGYTLTDEWGDDWILTDGTFIVDGWHVSDSPPSKGGAKE